MSSCYDLNQYPHDKLSSETFWKTETHAHQGMMSVYNQMKDVNVFGVYFWQDGLGEIAYDGLHASTIIQGTYTDRTSIIEKSGRTLMKE